MTSANAATVRAYHERTKHRPARYAAGPETLDWDAQPDPFRRFAGAPLTPLPLSADGERAPWTSLFIPGAIAARAPSLDSIGLLLELSFALSAWKQAGPDRWAVRCVPSSDNLHPTEVYLLTHGAIGLADGLYHYAPREHALERRALLADLGAAGSDAAASYRDLLREAGLIGQVLYLEAEAAGLRGTGIGCYFDDSVHELLGLGNDAAARWQVIYHFSVGLPLCDQRIATEAPYPAARPESAP